MQVIIKSVKIAGTGFPVSSPNMIRKNFLTGFQKSGKIWRDAGNRKNIKTGRPDTI